MSDLPTSGGWAALARFEAGEVLRSRWLLFCGVIYVALAAMFILVGLRESVVFGFTGMSRVLLSFCHVLVLLLPLLALTATAQRVGAARDSGALEVLLSLPISRGAYVGSLLAVRYLALTVPLVLIVLAMAVLGRVAFGQEIPWAFVVRTLALSAALIWAFCGIGLLLSTRIRSATRALLALLFTWAAGVALLDFTLIGLMLQWRLPARAVFALAALNPIEASRVALLASVEPELASLGPVGFYMSTRLGADALLAFGVLFPLLIGTVCAWAAFAQFRRSDVV
jgi:ABC-2 type transport system permease protein